MSFAWPSLDYAEWHATCDTLHAYTQILGKLAVEWAPPQPQLQHCALRLTARGWETVSLAAPDGSGALVVALDLRRHAAVVEYSDGREWRVPLTPNRAVADITHDILAAVGNPRIDPAPQEVPWTVPLDEDREHHTYDVAAVERYFAAATRAAQVLWDYRAPFRGRSTPVNAWWGSFDLSVSLFSGRPAEPPSDNFIMRNAMTAQEIAVGWWPGDPKYPHAAFYAYAYPANKDFAAATLEPAPARWDPSLGEFLLDWKDVCAADDPHAFALSFARSALAHGCRTCAWDPTLAASGQGKPPPVS